VSVTSRSEHRRAPVEIILGRGGLFGEDLIAHTGMMGATAYRSSDLLILDAREVRAAAARHPALRRVLDRLATIQRDAPWIVDHLRRAPILSRVAPSGIHALLEGAEIIDKKAGERIFDAQSDLGGLALVLSGEAHLKPAGVPLRPVVLGAGAVFGDEGILEQQPFGYDVYAGEDGCRVLRVLEQAFRAQIARSAAFRRAVAASREETARAHGAGAIGREDLALLLRSNWVALVGDDASLPLSTLTDWLAESAHTVWRDDVLVVHLDPSAPDPAPPPVVRDGIRHARLRPQGRPSAALVQACIRADMVLIDFGKVDAASERRLLRLVSRTVYVASTPYVDVPSRLLEAVTRPLLYTAVVPSPAPRPGEPRRVPRGAVRISRTLLDAARAGTARAALPARLQDQLDRWTRAVTERRVGLALGGGGALAFAHIALNQRVPERGLPVDMVAGVSGGSVIGAYYAAGEQLPLDPAGPIPQGLERWPGLVRILHRAGEFSRVCDRGVFFGFQIADWIDAELSSVLLEDLLLPFFPVATDIERAVQVSLRAGPIGFGVRASGALPGPFTPATAPRAAHLAPAAHTAGARAPGVRAGDARGDPLCGRRRAQQHPGRRVVLGGGADRARQQRGASTVPTGARADGHPRPRGARAAGAGEPPPARGRPLPPDR
jgi:CRP-like cAMP-binding protein